MGARVYVRHRILNCLDISDYLILLTTFANTALAGCIWALLRLGLGYDSSGLSDSSIEKIFLISLAHVEWDLCSCIRVTDFPSKMNYIGTIMYALASVALKASIAFLLLRFFNGGFSRSLVLCTAIIYTVYGVAFMLAMILRCLPVSYYWYRSGQDGHCIDPYRVKVIRYVQAVTSLVSDGIFALVPTVLIWNLQLPRRTKISVVFVLCLSLWFVIPSHLMCQAD